MKTCSDCGETKPSDEFYVDRSARDGRRHICGGCADVRTVAYMKQKREAFYQWKEAQPCMDCGGHFEHDVLEFDHRPDEVKLDNLSNLISRYSWERVRAEVEKCDLVCNPCHQARTAARRLVAA